MIAPPFVRLDVSSFFISVKGVFNLKEQCHEGFAALGQFCTKIITVTLRL